MAMRASLLGALLLAAVSTFQGVHGQAPPEREEVERSMGLRSEGELVRGQLDTVGFAVTREQAEDVVARAIEAERQRLAAAPEALVAAVCPHDDHLYAAGIHVHATERIAAPRVLLLGVFHKAQLWQLKDRLVFDRFQAWHGPWGPVPVDPLRGVPTLRDGSDNKGSAQDAVASSKHPGMAGHGGVVDRQVAAGIGGETEFGYERPVFDVKETHCQTGQLIF